MYYHYIQLRNSGILSCQVLLQIHIILQFTSWFYNSASEKARTIKAGMPRHTGIVSQRGRVTKPASKRKRMKSNWGTTVPKEIWGNIQKGLWQAHSPYSLIMHRLQFRFTAENKLFYAGLLTNGSSHFFDLPGICQWLIQSMLPKHSGGTARDSDPLPS